VVPAGAALAAPPAVAAVRARLAPLVQRAAAAVQAGQPGGEGLRAAVGRARAALGSGDLAAAGGAADELGRLLGGADGGGPAPGSLLAGVGSAAPASRLPGAGPPTPGTLTPATFTPVVVPPGGAGPGGDAGAPPSPVVALRDVAQGIPAAVAADPLRRAPLARLLADARASAEAGDAAAAGAKTEALRLAIAAPAGPGAAAAPLGAVSPAGQPARPALADGSPALSAQERMEAMQAGMERGRAEGVRGGVQVADNGQPPGRATDAGGAGAAGGSPSLLGRAGGFIGDRAPTWRQVRGAAEFAVGSGGVALGGFGMAAGTVETGAGVLATPLGGVGIPVVAQGLALTGASAVLGRASYGLAAQGWADMRAAPPPVAALPPPLAPGVQRGPQDTEASNAAIRRFLQDNPGSGPAPPGPQPGGPRAPDAAPDGPAALAPPGGAGPSGLAGARVDPGLGGQMQRAMQERMAAGGAGQAYGGLYGPAQAGVGGLPALPGGAAAERDAAGQSGQGAAAMSGLPPGWQGATGLPGLVPPPQVAPAPGTEPLPDDLRRGWASRRACRLIPKRAAAARSAHPFRSLGVASAGRQEQSHITSAARVLLRLRLALQVLHPSLYCLPLL